MLQLPIPTFENESGATSMSQPIALSRMHSRIAIVLAKTMSPGASANAAALLMGQISLLNPQIYGAAPATDFESRPHAAIRYSTVILKASSTQLAKLASGAEQASMSYCCFSAIGQSLNNEYETYLERLKVDPGVLVGVALFGSDANVRAMTRSYSLLQ